MKYCNSQDVVNVGQRVMYAGRPGAIVFVIDDDSYSDRYAKEHWSYLGSGLGIELDNGTLYRLDTPDEDLDLVS
jgi:hypothetical protein